MNWMGYGATRAAYLRRKAAGYYETIFVGKGLDIGCGDCRVTKDCATWDNQQGQGDAATMAGALNEFYDWVYSSHLLEHMEDPAAVLKRWWELVKPGGHLLVVVPDEDLFDQGMFPPPYAQGHKHTFTIFKNSSWSPASINLETWWKEHLPDAELKWLTCFDTNWSKEAVPQGRCSVDVEAHIELCLRKPLPSERKALTEVVVTKEALKPEPLAPEVAQATFRETRGRHKRR